MARTLTGTPAADGYAMPAEWAPHAGCYMIWPERPDNWRLGAKPAQAAWVDVATAVAAAEPLTVLVSAAQFDNARARLPEHVRLVETTTDDAWARDTCPSFLLPGGGAAAGPGELRGVDWVFNAWGGLDGGLYFPWADDDRVARKVCELERADRYRAPLVLEGGSVHVDGEGTVLVTEECLLNRNRNPSMARGEIEGHLRDHLGVEKVVWLGAGVYGDETDGHIDNLACFARPGVVLLTWTDDRDDPQYAISLDARRRLEAATDARGRSFEVIPVHQPGPLATTAEEAAGVDALAGHKPRAAGERLAGSYVNCYLANGRVVAPLLDERRDEAAMATLAKAFPEREVVGVPGREVLLGGGNVHCITQQVPALRTR